MKKKTPAALLIGVLLASALVFLSCEMEVAGQLELKPILRPHISLQPASASYYTNVNVNGVKDLFAQVWDWDAQKNGSLSFRWYTFTDDTMASFITSGSGTAVPGAVDFEVVESDGIQVINIPLSLSNLVPSTSAGKRFYYYLEVTNTDSTASDSRSIVTRSEIATISFASPGSPFLPRVNKQPANASYQFGRGVILTELEVKAVADDEGTLSYQWYYNTTGNTSQLIKIEGATNNTYGPTVEVLSSGRNYFFVEITNQIIACILDCPITTAGHTHTAACTCQKTNHPPHITTTSAPVKILSVPAVVTMRAGQTAMEPVIERQPSDGLYFTGETPKALSVKVEDAVDGGRISVQWYSNTTQDVRTGTAVSGANSTSYLPPVAVGTRYYYAVATNTNQGVTSNVKTATTNSRVAKVTFTTPGTSTGVNLTVTTRDPRLPESRYQYIRGYGGMDVAWANFPEQTIDDMETMFNPDWGLGYNMNRIMIPPGNTNVNVTIRNLTNSHRPHYYENAKIVNKYNGFNAAAPWTPPKEWKSNNSINGGGHLVHTYYQQYANYLRAYSRHMYDAGAPIYVISIQNEPNYAAGYDGCEWEPEEMRDFFKQVGHFTRGVRGWGGGKEIMNVLLMNGESANTPFINRPALRDPVSRALIDVYARHAYGSTGDSLWWVDPNGNGMIVEPALANSTMNNILKKPDGTFYEVWMTEHNINSASAAGYVLDSTWNYVWRFMNDIDLVIRLNNENAFVWWASKRFYSMLGDGQYGTSDGAPLPRGYGLSHYAKYSIDTHRIRVNVTGTTADGVTIANTDRNTSPLNRTAFNLDNLYPVINAFASMESGRDNHPVKTTSGNDWSDVNYISYVMYTPTSTTGSGGRNLGKLELKVPAGFVIGGASGHISTSAAAAQIFQPVNVEINQDRTSAFVTIGAGQILSVKLTRQE